LIDVTVLLIVISIILHLHVLLTRKDFKDIRAGIKANRIETSTVQADQNDDEIIKLDGSNKDGPDVTDDRVDENKTETES